jgi:hypothetical protein
MFIYVYISAVIIILNIQSMTDRRWSRCHGYHITCGVYVPFVGTIRLLSRYHGYYKMY